MTFNNFKVAHLNILSLPAKFIDIKTHLLEFRYDVLFLSETWLDVSMNSSMFAIEGYTLLRNDRRSRGGGVALYILNNLKVTRIVTSDAIEQLWISVSNNCDNVILGVAYRPPKLNVKIFLDELEITISSCMAVSEHIICLGDFNINLLDAVSPASGLFHALMEVVGLSQLINQPTRISKTSSTLLDLILTSDRKFVVESGVHDIHFSDHDLTFCEINLLKSVRQAKFVKYRNFKNINEGAFVRDLKQLPWNAIYRNSDIDKKIELFNSYITNLFDLHAPVISARITKPSKAWITDNIKLLKSLRNKAKTKFRKTKLPAHWEYYKSLRNFTTLAIRNEKKAYLNHKLLNNNSSKSVWKELKSLNIKISDYNEIPVHLQNANRISEFFENCIPREVAENTELKNLYNSNTKNNIEQTFEFHTVDQTSIVDLLNQIKTCSMGPDGIGINMIKLCCPFIIQYLTHIINCCLTQNIFPTKWKQAYVIPIAKIKQPTEYNHLRPISLLPTLSKVLEKIINEQLRNHLTKFDILPRFQSGFRPHYSCTTALLKITDDLLQAADQRKLTILVLLDFTKAFDTINYEVLFSILHYIGLKSNAIKLLKDYLTNRIQYVKVGEEISNPNILVSGVPQGSILGPLLFTIYTSCFSDCVKYCNYHAYADDTQLYYSFAPCDMDLAIERVNSDLTNIYETALKHNLLLNASKSQLMIFGNKRICNNIENLDIKINNVTIPLMTCTKNLGLLIDNNLRFTKHISKCIQNAYCKLRILYPHRHYLSTKVKTLLCEAYVLSQFAYCSSVYSPCLTLVDKHRIQRVQNSCLRFIFGIQKYDHVTYRLTELGWLNMSDRLYLWTATQYHKIIISKKPPYLLNKISFRTDIHNINIRRKGIITPPLHKSAKYERCFSYNLSKIYNSLANKIKTLPLIRFKRELKASLLTKRL